MSGKMCPLLGAGVVADGRFMPHLQAKCEEKGCAWWDLTYERCAILSIAKAIDVPEQGNGGNDCG